MIKILVATTDTQGQRENDFCFVPEGEIVTFGAFECQKETVDGLCGCKRSLVGVQCLKGTTTMRVIAWDQPLFAFTDLVYLAMDRGGFVQTFGSDTTAKRALHLAERTRILTQTLPLGAVVERRGDVFAVRKCAVREEAAASLDRSSQDHAAVWKELAKH